MTNAIKVAPIIAAVLTLAGCGSDDKSSGEGSDQAPKVEAAVRAWIDDNRCDLMSDRWAAEGYADADEGRAACEEEFEAGDVGIEAGEYEVADVKATGDKASATIMLKDGGKRDYKLVRGGPLDWQVDGFSEEFLTTVGKPLRFRDSIEVNGAPNEVDARVTVLSIKVVPRLKDRFLDDAVRKPGRKFVRVEVEVRSLADKTFEFSATDFTLVNENGERYTVSRTGDFEPELGEHGSAKLIKGDRTRGYISFQIPKAAKPSEIRLASAVYSDAEPLRWTVR